MPHLSINFHKISYYLGEGGWRLRLPLQACNDRVLFGDAFTGCKHGQCDGFRPQVMKPSGARIIQLSAQRRVDDGIEPFRRPWLHASLHTSAWTSAQVA